ncbi:MAG: methyl-accepting chemotaxis protein [Gammaproteobacteria bacterium]|nr:methyl-accepting chemotaxis protein [Gammaproteobacteria bacterium]
MLKMRITTIGILMGVLLAICAAAVAGYTYFVIGKVNFVDSSWNRLESSGLQKIDSLQRIQQSIGYGGMIHHFKNYVLRNDQKYADRIASYSDKIKQNLADYRKLEHSQAEADALKIIEKTIISYLSNSQRIAGFIDSGMSTAQIDAQIKIDDGPAVAALAEISKMIQDTMQSQASSVRESLALVNQFSRNAGTVVVVLLVLQLMAMFWLSMVHLGRPLKKMVKNMTSLAGGNLDINVSIDRSDEIGELNAALMVFRDNASEKRRLESEREMAEKQAEIDKRAAVSELVGRLRETIDAVANGDLTQHIALTGTDKDLTGLGDNLNQMIDNLSDMANKVRSASGRIGVALTEVRSALATQSSGAIQHEASVNETLSTLTEIKATSSRTIEQATSLGEVAEQSRQQSEQGLHSVEQAVDGMGLIREKVEDVAQAILDLSKKTQQIGEITDVVDDIAKQSKMLALNAAIEAAKAGEAGQRFAVVAEEIRNLAEQSQESTAQVKAILQDIRDSTERSVMVAEEGTKQVFIGVKVVEDAGTSMTGLSDVVSRTAASSQQIVAIIRQAATGVDQITTAIADISNVSRTGVSAVQQTELAMSDMQVVANELTEQVNFYKL